MHYIDLKNWVIKVIDSCENMRQLRTANRLTQLFEKNESHSHLKFYERLNLLEEVRISYYAKETELWDKRHQELINKNT